MAYQRSNFQAHLPRIEDYLPMNAFADYMQGYKEMDMLRDRERKAVQDGLMAEQQQLQNALLGARVPYAGDKERLANEFAEIQNSLSAAGLPYAGDKARLANELSQASIENVRRQNASPYSDLGKILQDYNQMDPENAFGRQLFEQYLKSKAEGSFGAQQQSTEKERVIQALQDPNVSEENKTLIRQVWGIPDVRHEGERPISHFPTSTQNIARSQNQKYLEKAESAYKAVNLLDELESIINENPGMHKYFARALTTDSLEPGFFEQLFRNSVIDEKQLTALQRFTKISNQLVADGASAFGGSRQFTDARQKLLQSIKPSAANTAEANRAIINGLKKELVPDARELENIISAIDRDVTYTPRHKLKKQSDNSSSKQAAEEEMIWVRNPQTGEEKLIPKAVYEKRKRK